MVMSNLPEIIELGNTWSERYAWKLYFFKDKDRDIGSKWKELCIKICETPKLHGRIKNGIIKLANRCMNHNTNFNEVTFHDLMFSRGVGRHVAFDITRLLNTYEGFNIQLPIERTKQKTRKAVCCYCKGKGFVMRKSRLRDQ
jgi:hypothetical protein